MTGSFAEWKSHPTVRAGLRAAGLLFAGLVVFAAAVGTQRAQVEMKAQRENQAKRAELPPLPSNEPLMPSYSAPAVPQQAPTATPSDQDVRNARNLAPPLPDAATEAAAAAPKPDFGPSAPPPPETYAAARAPMERALVTGIEAFGPREWEVRVRTDGGEMVRLRMRDAPRFNVGSRVRLGNGRIEVE